MNRNSIVAVIGDLGQGKTLYITAMAFLCYNSGYKIISNYELSFPHYKIKKIAELDEITDLDPKSRYFFAFDEPFMTVDARTSHTQRNIELAKRILQSRKMNISIYYSARFIREVEMRLRAVTGWIHIPHIVGVDEEGIPVALYIERHKRNIQGYMTPSSPFPFPMVQYDADSGEYVNVSNLYKTREKVKSIKTDSKLKTLLPPKKMEEYKDLIETKKVRKAELRSKITLEQPDLYKTDIQDLVNFLFLEKKIDG